MNRIIHFELMKIIIQMLHIAPTSIYWNTHNNLMFHIYTFNCCWLICYKKHNSQNVIHNRCLLILLIRKRLCIGVRFGHYNFGFNWTQFVSNIWSIMCEMGINSMHLILRKFKINENFNLKKLGHFFFWKNNSFLMLLSTLFFFHKMMKNCQKGNNVGNTLINFPFFFSFSFFSFLLVFTIT
jgi:hypothetical protein